MFGLLYWIRQNLSDLINYVDKIIAKDDERTTNILISCDGSILKNPGGRSAVGAVIKVPYNDPIEISQFTPASTNNEAEFDAIYVGLLNFNAINQIPIYPIIIESDSRLIIDSLNKRCILKEERLIKKRDLILQMSGEIPVQVTFKWHRRNSTPGLKRANDIAQVLNGVKPH